MISINLKNKNKIYVGNRQISSIFVNNKIFYKKLNFYKNISSNVKLVVVSENPFYIYCDLKSLVSSEINVYIENNDENHKILYEYLNNENNYIIPEEEKNKFSIDTSSELKNYTIKLKMSLFNIITSQIEQIEYIDIILNISNNRISEYNGGVSITKTNAFVNCKNSKETEFSVIDSGNSI